ncbi:MAG: hypothetical protein GX601_18255 [Anaerolineales bacterium]|nr:hypothetical protein [Anaerolineales bacterium]
MESNPPNPQGCIQPFDYEGVSLGPSRWRDQYERARDYFMALTDDDLLKDYRERAGLPSPGKHLGGWYSGDDKGMFYSEGSFGHTFPQWLSAFARMFRAAGDDAARDKAIRLVEGWAETISSDGYFLPGSRGSWAEYIYDKFVAALTDVAKYTGYTQALAHLERITDWALSHTNPADRKSEWYTLSENLYRAYVFTGDDLYRDFASGWHYTSMWDGLAAGQDAFVGHHAYSHVNTLGSAAMAFAVTGERQYFDAIDNAYGILQHHHTFATGGFGPKERFYPDEGWMGDALVDGLNWLGYPSSFETPCGCWAAFKFARYLTSFTGAAHYGDWIERLFYNGLGAALPMAGRGKTFYYSDYRMVGATKFYHAELWPCCSGTFPIGLADYHNLIYYRDDDGLYVSLFVPSEVTWVHAGQTVHVAQRTSFPESDRTDLIVHAPAPVTLALRIRVPSWLAGPLAAELNGERVALQPAPGGWAELRRVWRDGDRLSVTLPMRLAFAPVDRQHPRLAALTYGPIVLVADRGPTWPWGETITGDMSDPASWIGAGEQPLTFRVLNESPSRTFRPFYVPGEGEMYWMYFAVREPRAAP